jgi:hypothetical protein
MNMMNRRHLFAYLAILTIAPAILLAQSFNASVRGVVTDSSKAAIPAARITVTDVDRNLDYSTEADAMGRYYLTALPPGTYRFAAEAAGFQKATRAAFTLVVQQQATIDVELKVGTAVTAIEVQGAAPLLNATSATLGQVIENRYISELPLIARNPYTLSYLTPGITGAAGRQNDGNTNFVAVGTRNSTSDVMLDGISVTGAEPNSGITSIMHTPSVEAVQEFKVQTSYFSAEFGNTGGAIINMVTKSGTNQYHGSGYWFFRDDSLNANSFFSNRSGAKKSPTSRDVYGGTLGGPIKKDKTFFFASYERTDDQSAVTRSATFPTMAQRTGDFSNTRNSAGRLVTLYNPFSISTDAAGKVSRQPFAGNVIPQSMLDPIAVKAASYYPEPNQPGQAYTFVDNWFAQGVNASYNTQMELKADHNFNAANRVSMRWSPRWQLVDQANIFGAGKPAAPWSAKHGTIGGQKAMFDYTRVQSATTIFNLRFGITFHHYYSVPLVPFDLTALGLPKYLLDNASNAVFPYFSPSGYTAIGDCGWVVQSQEQGGSQILGSVTRILGAHNLKFGGEYKFNFLDYSLPGYPSGMFSFDRQITSQDLYTGSSLQGDGFASMLLGWGSGSRYDHLPWVKSRNAYWAGYVQDDWKVTRNLTINLGLRYELDQAAWEEQNRFSYWDLDSLSPLDGKVKGLGTLRGYMKFTDEDHRSPYPTPKYDFQPRVGLAYAVGSKTTIRSGYGMFFTLSRASVTGSIGTGFSTQSSVEWTRDSNLTRYASLANPYPDGMNLPPGRSLGAMTFIGMSASSVVPENIRPSYHSWNFSIQRQLPGSSVVEVNYTGTKGTHMFIPTSNLSPLDQQYWSLGRTALNTKVPNPFYGVITDKRSSMSEPTIAYNRLLRAFPQYNGASRTTGEAGGNSIYNAVQIRLEKRFSHGLSMLAHYTVSKALDNYGSGNSNYTFLSASTPYQDVFNTKNERALSASDIPQRLVVTFSYQLPFGKGKHFGTNWNWFVDGIAGGWSLTSFLTFQSGVPLYVSQSGGSMWEGTQRPNLIGDPSMPGSVSDRLYNYFNKAAFTRPAIDTFGSAPRELNYRAPGVRSADMALLKSFRVRERVRAEVRLEMQNATNTPGFAAPSNAFDSTSFGIISGYNTGLGPRIVQIGTRVTF